MAMKEFLNNEIKKDFSSSYNIPDRSKANNRPGILVKSNHPYFIQNDQKTVNTTVNCMDCIRIYLKSKELVQNDNCGDATLWSLDHLCEFNIKDMVVIFDDTPN